MTGGFFAKFYVFSAALQSQPGLAHHHRRAQQRVGAYYYLRIIVVMYMREARKQIAGDSGSGWTRIGSRDQRSGYVISRHFAQPSSAVYGAIGAGVAAAIASIDRV